VDERQCVASNFEYFDGHFLSPWLVGARWPPLGYAMTALTRIVSACQIRMARLTIKRIAVGRGRTPNSSAEYSYAANAALPQSQESS